MLLRLTKECRLLRGERVVDSAASHQSWPRQKFCCRRGSFHCACPTLSPSRRINDTPPGQRRVRSLLSLGYDRLGRDVKAHVFYLVRGAALSAQPPFSCSYSRVDRRDALLTAATKNCMAIIEEGIWKMHQIEAMFHLARLFDFRSFFFFPWDSSFLVGQIRRLGQTRWLPSVAGAISFPGGSTPANWLRLPWFQFSQVYALVRAHYRSAIHLSLSLSLSLLSVFWLLSSSHSLPTLFKPSTGQPSVTPRPHPKASPQELQQRKILHVRRKI